jgi:lipopolysaccharide export LptBFGC system permease protein LptF
MERTGWQRVLGAIVPRPVAIRHGGSLLIDASWLILAFVAGVEAVFLTDLVINRILPRVLEHGASLVNVLVLVVLSIPSCLYIALPISVLAAVYFTVLRRREAREFIVLAGMGLGAGPILRLALFIGSVGLILSLSLSGHVEPLARYAANRTLFDVRLEAIRNNAIGAGKFYHVDGTTVFAGSGQSNQVANSVFFIRDQGEGRYQLVTAMQSRRSGESATTNAGVVLRNAAAYDFQIRKEALPGVPVAPDCEDCTALRIAPGDAHASNWILVDLPNLQFPDSRPRGGRIEERTSFELLGEDLTRNSVKRELGDRLFRGLLVFLAPLLAVLAVALTRPALFVIALPAAASLVLAGSFFGSRLIEALSPLGLHGMTAVLIAGAVGLTGLVISLIYRFENGCIQHGGVQL